VGGVVLAYWSPWPTSKTFFAGTEISILRMMELFAQKVDFLSDLLFVQVGLLIALFGRHFKAGWHSHTQQVSIGLFMASLSQLAVRFTLQQIATPAAIHSQEDYKRVVGLINSLNSANTIIFIVVVIWWIVCLWFDEPGSESRDRASGVRVQGSDDGTGDQETQESI
jgi:hypothetical protein